MTSTSTAKPPTFAVRRAAAERALCKNLRAALPTLTKLYAECSGEWGYEDPVYRFYHHSFKIYAVQKTTVRIVEALRTLSPDRQLDEGFTQIVADGTGKTFEYEHNKRSAEVTRPSVEAFFHARYFLEMAVRYGRARRRAGGQLPTGWAAFLTLYGLR